MKISFRHKGDFKKTEKFFTNAQRRTYLPILHAYGQKGVDALSASTPFDSGLTSLLWNYEIHELKGSFKIVWTNANINQGVPIAILIQYGHGTRTGGYVQGQDYINPAMKPIFDKLADEVWKEIRKA